MHHTINLGYGDSVTITTPEHAPIKLQALQHEALKETITKYIVFQDVCNATGITLDEILGKNRKQIFVLARCFITAHLLTNYHLTMSDIARLLGRDHSTIIHYKRLYKNLNDVQDNTLINFLNQLNRYEKAKN